MRRVDAVELCSEQRYRTSDRIGKKQGIHLFPHLGQVCARWAGPVGEADQGERFPLPGLEKLGHGAEQRAPVSKGLSGWGVSVPRQLFLL